MFCNDWAIAQSTTLPGLLGAPIPTEDQNALPQIAIPDLFHDFFAGIFQSLVMTLLRLVFALTKIENTVNKNAMGEIDKRTSHLVPKNSYIPNLPHLDWCIYSDGLATIFFKDKGDHSGATGKAGQMRSAWSLNQVIMLLMAIGPWGELIPNENTTVEIEGERFINIPNPTRITCNAIYLLFHIYVK
jgi:hypothetical protein